MRQFAGRGSNFYEFACKFAVYVTIFNCAFVVVVACNLPIEILAPILVAEAKEVEVFG